MVRRGPSDQSLNLFRRNQDILTCPEEIMKNIFLFLFCSVTIQTTTAQDAAAIAKKVKDKLATVNDYQATGTMKTDVSFMKIPASEVTVYYKKPNQFRIKRQEGITVTPKGGVSINLNSLFTGDNYTAVYTGVGTVKGERLA